MLKALVAAILAVLFLSTGLAEDQPAIGPAPDWVLPIDAPLDAKADEAAVRVLLQDQQVLFEGGKTTIYSSTVLRIQTPQGLSAGNLSLPWRPDTDVLTVHRLIVRRGAEVIDVLAAGQSFMVMRRETNLESAMLDGVLTANIQPEGLQVGDVIELATSVTSSDPTMQGHAQHFINLGLPFDVARLRVRILWPKSMALQIKVSPTLPAMQYAESGDRKVAELKLDDVQPVTPPKGAPTRFLISRTIEISDFQSWSEAAALMVPLYEKASALSADGKLQAEIDKIKAAVPDTKARAEAALALVQDRVRYVLFAMGTGNLVPADAETTWSRRFGDCKGKTSLLLALLNALDIEAEPVLVSTVFGEYLSDALPGIALFDHVIVRAHIDGKDYWLDGTRSGDTSLDRITIPAFGWGLPVTSTDSNLVRMIPAPLEIPSSDTYIEMDASAGLSLPAPTKIDFVLRGDEALSAQLSISNLSGDVKAQALKKLWKSRFDFIDVDSTSTRFDPATGEFHFLMEGKAKMDWESGSYEPDDAGVGYHADFSRDPGPQSDAPFAVPYPFYTRTTQVITLPPGDALFSISGEPEIDQTAGGINYRRHAKIEGNVFTIETTQKSLVPEFPASQAETDQATLRDLENKRIGLVRPYAYLKTEAERAAEASEEPKTAEEFFQRGFRYDSENNSEAAIADYTRVLELDPKHKYARANRAMIYVWEDEFEKAIADLDIVDAENPRNEVAFRARGLMALKQTRYEDAIKYFTTSLEIDAESAFSLRYRAAAFEELDRYEEATSDYEAAIKAAPPAPELYPSLANALVMVGRGDEAAERASKLMAENPKAEVALIAASEVFRRLERPDDAVRALDGAVAVNPSIENYLMRSAVRPRADIAARRADVEKALAIDPESTLALSALASICDEQKDYQCAIKVWGDAIASSPDDPIYLVQRGISYALSGQRGLAANDFVKARSKAIDAIDLNDMCWAKATANVSLASALLNCDAALETEPTDPRVLDSRGFVLLRLGRNDDAIASYEKALAGNPRIPATLFGLSVAWKRKGNPEKAATYLRAAVKISWDIEEQFASYGITD